MNESLEELGLMLAFSSAFSKTTPMWGQARQQSSAGRHHKRAMPMKKIARKRKQKTQRRNKK